MKITGLFIAAFAILLVGFTSCNKNWTCSCTDGSVLPIDNAKKSDAEDACAQYQMIVKRSNDSTTCKL